ncbi:DNA-binding response regulator [Chitinophaga silvatica]|uniref:DNA-binding response regulator n=1 Tax=Chitinophaga silvatica TaxID=2282649 RepID=A0A3E1YHX8_9BACT|nr:response regulator transcription factor [Chitinophaga silvatica]RFS26944.1 DNA-binding response regulator [Chitinophaga silvatica]
MSIKIIIADDHPIFLTGLKEVIEYEKQYEVIFSAKNGEEAVRMSEQLQPDVVILDIDMPVMNGLTAATEILRQNNSIQVILLTMHKVKDAFLHALELGVSGYVLKENAVTDIINSIQSVLKGQSYISPEMSSFLLHLKRNRMQTIDEQLKSLTPAEQKILKMIGSYKSTKEIADELFISEKTVSNHRMNMTKKLNLTGKNALLRFAIEQL